MAFDIKGLRRTWIGGALGNGLGSVLSGYHYVTNDDAPTVETAGYFNGAALALVVGDRIDATLDLDGVIGGRGYTVLTNDGTNVTVRRGTAGLTDNSGGTAGTTLAAGLAKVAGLIMPAQLVDFANAQVFKLVVPFAFQLTGVGWRTGKPATTASKLASLQAQVNGVATTGGLIALTSANQATAGVLTAGSAITAGGVGTAGQTIEIAQSSVTAFVEGDGWVEFGLTNLDLANAIATLAAR